MKMIPMFVRDELEVYYWLTSEEIDRIKELFKKSSKYPSEKEEFSEFHQKMKDYLDNLPPELKAFINIDKDFSFFMACSLEERLAYLWGKKLGTDMSLQSLNRKVERLNSRLVKKIAKLEKELDNL